MADAIPKNKRHKQERQEWDDTFLRISMPPSSLFTVYLEITNDWEILKCSTFEQNVHLLKSLHSLPPFVDTVENSALVSCVHDIFMRCYCGMPVAKENGMIIALDGDYKKTFTLSDQVDYIIMMCTLQGHCMPRELQEIVCDYLYVSHSVFQLDLTENYNL
jgi:hypothetical protein